MLILSGINFQSAIPRFKAKRTTNSRKAATNPSKASTNQTKAATNQTKAATNPSKAATNPSEAATNQSKAATNQTKAATNQTKPASNLSKAALNSSKATKKVSKTEITKILLNKNKSPTQHKIGEKQPKSFQTSNKCSSNFEKKSSKPSFQRIFSLEKFLRSFSKVKKFTESRLKMAKKEVILEKSPYPVLNCSYEKGNPYTTIHYDKKYTCQMTYLVTHVMRCLRVKVKHKSRSRSLGFESQYVQQCLVEKKRLVYSWQCSRRLNDTQWYSFSFNRINSSVTSLTNLTSYAGMSFTCAKYKTKSKSHVIK